jgi:hypothetical protein
MASTPFSSIQRRTIADAMSGLFWWIGGDDLDLLAEHGRPEILDRELRGGDRALAAEIGIELPDMSLMTPMRTTSPET